MTHSYVTLLIHTWHDAYIRDPSHDSRAISHLCVWQIWRSHVAHMKDSCLTQEKSHVTHINAIMALSFVRVCHKYEGVTSHICMTHATHKKKSRDTHAYDSWAIFHLCVWHTWMSHDTHILDSCHTREEVTSHVWMQFLRHLSSVFVTRVRATWVSHVTHMNDSCHT